MARDVITPLLLEIRDAVAEALEPTPGRVLIAPGLTAAYDDCCDGQVWVRLVSVVPVYPSNAVKGCGPLYRNVTVEVGVIRCAATVDSQGRAPAPDAITADAEQAERDLAAVEGVLECGSWGFTNLSWSPLGVEGGCQGGAWTGTTKVNTCGC